MEVNDNVIMTTLSANQMQNIGGQQTRYITVSANTPIKNAVHQNVIYSTNSPHGSPVILQSPSRGGTAQVFHTYTQLTNQRTPQQGVKREESPSSVYMVEDKRGPKIMRLKTNSAIVDRVVPGGNSAASGKGLRHFSMKVCEQVRKRGKTTYNEVADELVNEFSERGSGTSASYDQKNIRRRVYDALNVLMAMGIIEKKHKEIHWLGLPTNSAQECVKLEEEKRQRLSRIAQKTQQLYDLIIQHVAYKNLVEKNKSEALVAPPTPHSTISLPFIIINTSKKTVIDCQISNDKRDYLFNFDNSFEIHDDIEVLKRMGLALGLDKGTATSESVQAAKTMVPKSLQPFVEQLARSRDELPPGMMKLNKANLSVTEEAVISILPSPSSEEAYSDEEQMGYA